MFAPVESDLCPKAQEQFNQFVRVRRLAVADLYGSKLCAALDRQHPRDLFDVMLLQNAGEISDEIRQAFVVYLAGCNRPMYEILVPNRIPFDETFSHNFSGMTEQLIELRELEAARDQLFEWIVPALTENERRFILSIKEGSPNWSLLPFEGLDQLPAIKWKLLNIKRMDKRAHSMALARLRDALEI